MRRLGWVAGAAAGVLVVVAVLTGWHTAASTPDRDAQAGAMAAAKASASAPASSVHRSATSSAASSSATAAHALSEASVLTSEERQALRAELSGRPDAEAEFQRIVAWLNFSRQWEAFQAARARGDDPTSLRATASALDTALPARWQQGELTGPQALQLKSQLLEVLLPTDAERQTVLQSWRDALAPSVGPTPAERQFLEAQTRLLAAYRAQAPAQQNVAALKAQLELLREQHFRGSGKP